MLNSGLDKKEKEFIERVLHYTGPLPIASDELYDLDAQVRLLFDPLISRYFPDQMRQYNLIFSADTGIQAQVLIPENKTATATVIVTHGLLKILDSNDELLAVLLHESFHHLRARLSDDPWYARILNGMAEEGRADAFAVRVLAENSLSPMGMSLLLEKTMTHTPIYRSGTGWEISGLSSHPPTALRLTAVNALIEQLSERKHFPERAPLSGVLLKAKETPLKALPYSSMSFGAVNASNLGSAYEYIHSDDLAQNVAEFELMRKRVIRENLPAWGAVESWTSVAKGFEKAWKSLTPWSRIDSRFADLFIAEERRLRELAASFGLVWPSEAHWVVQDLRDMAGVTSVTEILNWANDLHRDQKIPTGMDRLTWIWEKFSKQTYLLTKDPSVFEKAFEHYLSLTPLLYSWAQQAIAKGALENPRSGVAATLAAIIDYRDIFITHFAAWAEREGTKATAHYSMDAFRNLSYEKTREIHDKIFQRWNQRIGALNLPDYVKTAFFPSIEVEGGNRLNWGWRHQDGYIEGLPLIEASMAFLEEPSAEDQSFHRFHQALLFLRAMQDGNRPVQFNYRGPSRYDDSSFDFPIHMYDPRVWALHAIRKLSFTQADAFDLLNTDFYWQKPPEREKQARSLAESVTNNLFFPLPFSRYSPFTRKERKIITKERDAELDRFFKPENFYNRPEYRLDVTHAQSLQNIIYDNLKKNHALPGNLKDEVVLWQRFGKRGVSAFTDEWASSLMDRLFALAGADPQRLESLKVLYYSNLVWDLPLRRRLAAEIYRPENDATVAALSQSNAGSANPGLWKKLFQFTTPTRREQINQLLEAIVREFPEDSQERVLVVDRIAEHINANREETTHMMNLVGRESAQLSSVSISKKMGFGVRFYTQLFAELKNAPLHLRLELLDFFLGKSDSHPSLLHPSHYSRMEQDERRRFPVLNEVAGNIERNGIFRVRRSFQALSVQARTVVIDPLLVGTDGLLTTTQGREWFINTLVPAGAKWRQMAVDLTEGFVAALQRFGQAHLKTMFLSYMVASNTKSGRGQFTQLFADANAAREPAEDQEGRVLRSLFSATNALIKLGQRLHSSNVLHPGTNRAIESLKETAADVLRENKFQWIDDALIEGAQNQRVQLGHERGNASVKIVSGATIDGVESLLYLIKPNASFRGDSFFQIIEGAVQYAVDRGHNDLKVVQPMIRRARATFQRETDMTQERAAVQAMRPAYSPGKHYGAGGDYQFISLEYLPIAQQVLKAKHASAVRSLKTKRFSELTQEEQQDFAHAVTQKESEILSQSHGVIQFDQDRHEGNYLLVTDEGVRSQLGLRSAQKLILVIDLPQVAQISAQQRDALLDALAAISAYGMELLPLDESVRAILDALKLGVLAGNSEPSTLDIEQSPDASTELQEAIIRLLPQGEGRSAGQALSRLLAHLESEGFTISNEVWDYLTALNTLHTWQRYEENNAVEAYLQQAVLIRCQRWLGGK